MLRNPDGSFAGIKDEFNKPTIGENDKDIQTFFVLFCFTKYGFK